MAGGAEEPTTHEKMEGLFQYHPELPEVTINLDAPSQLSWKQNLTTTT